MVEQILRRLRERGWLNPEQDSATTEDFQDLLEGLRVQSLIEFERAVHAEMAAITLAARRGISVQDAFAYTTTFPCHECTRHIIAAGIRRVFYIEPYPKSLAEQLHPDSIVIDPDKPPKDKVAFLPFVGVSPRRYQELFTPSPNARKGADNRVALPMAGWLPKGVPSADPPPSSEEIAASFEDEGVAAGPVEEETPDVPNGDGEADAPGEVDLTEEAGAGLASAGARIEHTSDSLYILREGSLLVELEDAFAKSGLDFLEAAEGEEDSKSG